MAPGNVSDLLLSAIDFGNPALCRPRRLPKKNMKRRRRTAIQGKVRTLKKLIPNCGESMGVEGLFRETADYIMDLKIRVKVMQAMVDLLSAHDDDDDDDGGNRNDE